MSFLYSLENLRAKMNKIASWNLDFNCELEHHRWQRIVDAGCWTHLKFKWVLWQKMILQRSCFNLFDEFRKDRLKLDKLKSCKWSRIFETSKIQNEQRELGKADPFTFQSQQPLFLRTSQPAESADLRPGTLVIIEMKHFYFFQQQRVFTW